MKRLTALCAIVGLMLAAGTAAQAVTINGATSGLDLRATITLSNGAVLTFVPGHGANAAASYIYTDVGGTVMEDNPGESGWSDASSYTSSATTSNGDANGSVTVNTAGFDYSISADALVEGLSVGDNGNALGYAYAWPDWLRTDAAGTATITLSYSYTLDTQDTIDDATSWIYMNAFFADHPGDNYLTAKDDWTLSGGPGTTVVEFTDTVGAGALQTVTDSVSWDIVIPSTAEPYNWWSLWVHGEAGVDLTPIPEPGTMTLLALGLVGIAAGRRRRALSGF